MGQPTAALFATIGPSTAARSEVHTPPPRSEEQCASPNCELPLEPHELSAPVDLKQWSFTHESEYRGESHPDGTPLTYAPALGIPASLLYPEKRPLQGYAYNSLYIPSNKPEYRSFSPVQVLQMYDSLSNAPYTIDTANIEAELLQRPLPEHLELDHQLRIRTLERWWEVKDSQRAQKNTALMRQSPRRIE
ncbi:MAG: hypothetical protein L6R36_002480 [Xanthoria steineri]|nr:MAG: hypothetical protein L6R36_002480 [Xanthoria steineri]